VGEIRSFLGLAGYYRRFIEGFSKLVKPMTSLLEKNAKFIWSDQCQASFEELKERLTTTPILVLPDLSKKLFIAMPLAKVWGVFLFKKVELLPMHLGS
jgi:hypothetical protein